MDSHDAPMQAVDTLKVRFLANFMRKANILTFALASDNESDIVAELVERILQELASVRAYLDCWRAQTFSVAKMWQKHCEKTSPTSCYPGQSLTEYLWPSVMTAAS